MIDFTDSITRLVKEQIRRERHILELFLIQRRDDPNLFQQDESGETRIAVGACINYAPTFIEVIDARQQVVFRLDRPTPVIEERLTSSWLVWR